jgi:hypothetical protein
MSGPAFNEEAFRWSYALCKQLGSAHTIASSYGDIDLDGDDELKAAIDAAVRPILVRRLREAEGAGQPGKTTLTDSELAALARMHRIADAWNGGRLDDALFDMIDLAMARDGCADLIGED